MARPPARKAQSPSSALIGRLTAHLSLLAEAKAALADIDDVNAKALPQRVVHSIQRAFAYPPAKPRTLPRKKR